MSFLFWKSFFSISATVVIRATWRNKIQGTPITSFWVRPFRRWQSGRAELFRRAFFLSQLPRRRTDRNQNAQRTINHCIPKRNSYAVTPIEMHPLKSDRSLSHSPKSSRVPSGLPSCDERMAVRQRDRESFFRTSRLALNRCSQKFLTKRKEKNSSRQTCKEKLKIFYTICYCRRALTRDMTNIN